MTTPAVPPFATGTSVSLPAPVLTVPIKPEEHFPMSYSDWDRLRLRVESITNPRRWATQLGWACIGIATSAALALFPWAAARSQLTPTAQVHYAWITLLLVVIAAACLVLAIACYAFSRTMKDEASSSVKSICDDMDRIYEPHRRTTS